MPTTFLLLLLRSVTQKSLCNCSNVHLFYWQAYREISDSASVCGYRNLSAKAMEMKSSMMPQAGSFSTAMTCSTGVKWERKAGRPSSVTSTGDWRTLEVVAPHLVTRNGSPKEFPADLWAPGHWLQGLSCTFAWLRVECTSSKCSCASAWSFCASSSCKE